MPDFLRPRMVGSRFEDGKIPLEMLNDLSVLQEMIIEVAKWRYLVGNPHRSRSPKGFADGVSFRLAGVEKGSAVPLIDVEFHSPEGTSTPQMSGMPPMFEEYYSEARDAIIDAIAAAEEGGPTTGHLPQKYLEYFDRIGSRLRDDESIEFPTPAGGSPARLTRESRRRLVLASRINEISEVVELRGYIPEADQDRMSFELQFPGGRKIPAAMNNQHLEVVLETFNGYPDSHKVLIRGIGKRNRQGSLMRVESIEEISELDPLDVPSRLAELQELRDGWLDGDGRAPISASLNWLSRRFEDLYPSDLPLPHIYPTIDGGVLAEWSLSPHEVSLSVDLTTNSGEWHELNADTNDEEADTFDLNNDDDWKQMVQRIKSLSEGGN